MTKKEFYELVRNPEKVQSKHAAGLKELVERYPYFYQARLLWLKSLKLSDDIQTSAQLSLTAIYSHDHRWLYFYLFPEMKPATGNAVRQSRYSGSYFDLLNAVEAEGGDAQSSLRRIADQLKESRAKHVQDKQEETATARKQIDIPVPEYFRMESASKEIDLEEKSRTLIREKRYQEALEILKQLNLINPKKSIYFADQIRFLEKIIVNTNNTR